VTPEGAEAAQKMKRAVAKVQQRILDPLSPAEQDQLVRLLDRLVAGHEDEPAVDV
jgi:DNA-binding MarR family transcriptional regulator